MCSIGVIQIYDVRKPKEPKAMGAAGKFNLHPVGLETISDNTSDKDKKGEKDTPGAPAENSTAKLLVEMFGKGVMMQLQSGGQTSTAQAAAAAAAGTSPYHSLYFSYFLSSFVSLMSSFNSLPAPFSPPFFPLLSTLTFLSSHLSFLSFLLPSPLSPPPSSPPTAAVASSVSSALCVKEIKVNCKGNRVAILAEHVEGALQVRHRDRQLYVFDHNKGR